MKTIINDANSYIPDKSDRLFFDCNTLMYIYYTFGGYKTDDITTYSRIFTTAIKKGADIIIPSIFLSEFANTYIQNEYKRYLLSNKLKRSSFKFKRDYKPTADYATAVQDIKNIILNQLLPVSKKIDDPFTMLDISHIFDKESIYDFNDRYYGLLARHYNFKIVTNDADFKNISGIEIITRNPFLLPSV